ncbi:hypothetical protein ABVK25_000867 [Lepraria finkii]|uniref:Uncharacterized protein n=1 Tax=Lepraria finkii TaxID=1340010 RepID=A0ABR4BP35_9LECA
MFFSISRLGLAAFVPAMVLAQSTTYSFTVNGNVHSIILPSPSITSTTIFVTHAAATVTITPPASIETRIFTVTGPAPVVASIEGAIPSGAEVQGSTESPGPIIPIAINGYTTSVQFPASASIPTSGPVTIAPANPVPASMASNAQSAASNEAVVASNVAGTPVITYNPAATNTATNAADAATSSAGSAASAASTAGSVVTNVPVPIGPLNSLSASLQSVSSAASTAFSSAAIVAVSSFSSASAASVAAVSSITTLITTATGSPTATDTGTISTGSASTTVTTPTTLLTTTSGAASTATTTSSVVASTTTSTAAQSSSPSSSSAPPGSSSTAAPTHSGAGASRFVWREGVRMVAGLVALFVVV